MKGKFNLKELYQKSSQTIQKVSQSATEEINKGLVNVNSNLRKTSKTTRHHLLNTKDKISEWGNTAKKQVDLIVTKTGRKIKIHSEEIKLFGAGIAAGVTGLLIFQKLNQEDDTIVEQYQEEKVIIQSYQEVIDKNPEEMSIEDWRAYVANISAHLETQLRLQLDLSGDYNPNLYGLLIEAENNELLAEEELQKLHMFRVLRNNLLHNLEIEEIDVETIQWTSYFVDEF